jgi:hypothetical protein
VVMVIVMMMMVVVVVMMIMIMIIRITGLLDYWLTGLLDYYMFSIPVPSFDRASTILFPMYIFIYKYILYSKILILKAYFCRFDPQNMCCSSWLGSNPRQMCRFRLELAFSNISPHLWLPNQGTKCIGCTWVYPVLG